MFNFPDISMIRFPKLIVHSILLTIELTFLSLFAADLMSLILGKPVEASSGFVTLVSILWLFFAVQSPKYKQS